MYSNNHEFADDILFMSYKCLFCPARGCMRRYISRFDNCLIGCNYYQEIRDYFLDGNVRHINKALPIITPIESLFAAFGLQKLTMSHKDISDIISYNLHTCRQLCSVHYVNRILFRYNYMVHKESDTNKWLIKAYEPQIR